MPQVSQEQLWAALRTIIEPELNRDIVSLNMVKNLNCDDSGKVSLTVVLTTPACPLRSEIENAVKRALMQVPGVRDVAVEMSANVSASFLQRDLIPGVRNIIGIGSTKGGVGKSTVAVNLAVALSQMGAKVGLLDADIYGPNIPMMLGLRHAQPEVRTFRTAGGEEVDKLLPVENYGVRVMSMGFLLDEEQPVIWRGPMLNSALRQFLGQVEWGDLDYLLVDLPPGTGDVQISLIQLTKVTGMVQVTTPQQVALQDVRRGITMFKSQNIPILGVIENMSYFVCPHCKKETNVFARNGGKEVAEAHGVPFLGEIPLFPQICAAGDAGVPIVAAEPSGEVSQRYFELARRLAARISMANYGQNPSDGLNGNPLAGENP
ncbi:MAG: Mrp/NBP35 family ATP-binding protein [Candidatus Sumerlaeaceae bacterium]|nr:Mrp/NBP35 family ATP-binding protein [Candidatus Sumerlaeaceae bacterium]